MKHFALTHVVIAMIAIPAVGQLNEAQQKCANVINASTAKLAKAQGSDLKNCVKQYAKDPVNGGDPDVCLYSSPKEAAAEAKVAAKMAEVCDSGDVPPFGPNSALTADIGAFAVIDVAYELISESELTNHLVPCATDGGVTCKCQEALLTSASKFIHLHLNLFNKCKKAGLKSETVVDEASLRACLIDPAQHDPKGKLAKAGAKLEATVAKKCAEVAEPLPDGLCPDLAGAPLADCIEQRVRCAACAALSGVDEIEPNCDLFDDAIANDSCGTYE